MRKFLTGMFVMLFIIAVILAAVFGYLFFTRANEISQAKQDKLDADLQVSALQSTVTDLTKPRTFSDTGLGVTVNYPFDWVASLSTNIDSFASSSDGLISGAIISEYQLMLVKGDAKLTFVKMLGGIGSLPQELDPAHVKFVVIPSAKGDLVRYTLIGQDDANTWSYGAKVDCSELPEPVTQSDAVCAEFLFPGFGKAAYASRVNLSGTADQGTIEEADQIVLSAQR